MAYWTSQRNPEQEPQLLRGFPCKQLSFRQKPDKTVLFLHKSSSSAPAQLSSTPQRERSERVLTSKAQQQQRQKQNQHHKLTTVYYFVKRSETPSFPSPVKAGRG